MSKGIFTRDATIYFLHDLVQTSAFGTQFCLVQYVQNKKICIYLINIQGPVKKSVSVGLY